jgi:hypothetical protein
VIGGSLPTAIGSLSSLEILDMNFNLLEGPLPTQLYSLTRLTQIDLNDNLLTGPIGTGIGSLADLTFFQVQTNQLTGTLPSELQQLLALGALVSLSRGTAPVLLVSMSHSRPRLVRFRQASPTSRRTALPGRCRRGCAT